jgi:hypothetical protein
MPCLVFSWSCLQPAKPPDACSLTPSPGGPPPRREPEQPPQTPQKVARSAIDGQLRKLQVERGRERGACQSAVAPWQRLRFRVGPSVVSVRAVPHSAALRGRRFKKRASARAARFRARRARRHTVARTTLIWASRVLQVPRSFLPKASRSFPTSPAASAIALKMPQWRAQDRSGWKQHEHLLYNLYTLFPINRQTLKMVFGWRS